MSDKNTKPEAPVTEGAGDQQADLAAKLAELEAKLAQKEKEAEEAKKAAEAAAARADEAEKAEKAGKASKPTKRRTINVISDSGYSYLLEDNVTRVTPDIPVKAEVYEGNLLDGLMKAGLVIEYEA